MAEPDEATSHRHVSSINSQPNEPTPAPTPTGSSNPASGPLPRQEHLDAGTTDSTTTQTGSGRHKSVAWLHFAKLKVDGKDKAQCDKRSFEDLDVEEDDVFGSKKGRKAEESGPGATGMIFSLRESLQSCKDSLATCQAELETAQSEIRKWYSTVQNVAVAPTGTNPEPELVITYLQNLKSSEESLKEKLEKAKKREAAFIVTYAKREQEIVDLKSTVRDLKKQLRPPSSQTRRLLLDPAIHEEFTRLKNLVEEKEKKVKELQDNVSTSKFNANSRMGNMLMAKCRTLQEENEEIGAMANEGKIHELAMKIAVLKSQNAELRHQFNALHKHMEGLIDEVEKSNELVLILQDKVEAKDYELEQLEDELKRTNEMLAQREAAAATVELPAAQGEAAVATETTSTEGERAKGGTAYSDGSSNAEGGPSNGGERGGRMYR